MQLPTFFAVLILVWNILESQTLWEWWIAFLLVRETQQHGHGKYTSSSMKAASAPSKAPHKVVSGCVPNYGMVFTYNDLITLDRIAICTAFTIIIECLHSLSCDILAWSLVVPGIMSLFSICLFRLCEIIQNF